MYDGAMHFLTFFAILSVVPAAWDAVVTCFFLDTAHNIVEYIEIISKVLKDGGVSSHVTN
jgi:hypothetical protein